ncbi:E3 ubiquitin-protein ligase TRIM71-like [Mytilus trossulus]|uniref:E3 ubiquitin-protein ligase TRIM71-like n=1 Tax=Mytilus trossulus TaxID=6551 RepID=UPI0030052A1E
MAQAASKTCEVCLSAPGSQYCIDCEEYYCGNCKLLHNRLKLSRNHQFQKASDLIPEGKSKCYEHKEEITLICNTCNAQICTRCVTGKHNGHIFSQIVDVIAQLEGESETKIRAKTNEANQSIKKIEESLKSFDNSVESVIKAITDEGRMIKRMVDKAVAQMITLVKEQSKKEKEKLMIMLSDAKSVLDDGQALDRKRTELKKIRQDGSLVQKINNMKEEINKLKISSLPEFPNISFSRKSVAEDDIRQLIGTYTISNCSPILEKVECHGKLYGCTKCGDEQIIQLHSLNYECFMCGGEMLYYEDV